MDVLKDTNADNVPQFVGALTPGRQSESESQSVALSTQDKTQLDTLVTATQQLLAATAAIGISVASIAGDVAPAETAWGVNGQSVTSNDLQAGADVTDPPLFIGEHLVIDGVQVSAFSAMAVRFFEQDTDRLVGGPIYLNGRSTVDLEMAKGWKIAQGKKLRAVADNAGSVSINVGYHSEPLDGGVIPYGAMFFQGMRENPGPRTWYVSGDSTGNATVEWVFKTSEAVAAEFLATYAVDYYLWNNDVDPKRYDIQAMFNRNSTFATMQDTFNRADGPLGTVSSGGQTWAANTWLINANRAQPNAVSTLLRTGANLATSSFKIEVTLSATLTGDYRCVMLDNGTSFLMAALRGTGNLELYVNTGTGNVNLFSIGALGLTPGQPYKLTMIKDGLNITFELNGRRVGATLTPSQEAALVGRSVYFTSVSSITGHFYEDINIGAVTKPANLLTVRNASVTGTGFQYHLDNLAAEIPTRPDFVTVNLGHNENSDPATFAQSYIDFVAAVRAQAGGAPVPLAATIQNPRTNSTAAAHLERMLAAQALCIPQGWDCINVLEAFLRYPNWQNVLITPDGIHPTDPLGDDVWWMVDMIRFGLALP